MKVLVVDDDRMLARFIEHGLQEEGHVVDVAHDGQQGRTLALVNDYDALVLDVVMPGMSGLVIAHDLRRRGCQTPILMLTGRAEKSDIVLGLDAGADDYLVKPFVMAELKARVRALLRRGGARRPDDLALGALVLHRATHRATSDGTAIPLTPKEYALLEQLMLRAGQVIARTELLEKVWDLHFDPGSNVVDVHVARLRDKLRRAGAPARIDGIRGVGYTLVSGAEASPTP
jgi:DNA-binding response OmpR family regulator